MGLTPDSIDLYIDRHERGSERLKDACYELFRQHHTARNIQEFVAMAKQRLEASTRQA